MEGFTLECSKLPSWAFDPVSSDVLLMPHAKSKSILQTSLLLGSSSSSPGGGISLPHQLLQHNNTLINNSSFYSSSSYNSSSTFDPASAVDSDGSAVSVVEGPDTKLYHLPTLTLASLTPGTTFIFDTSGLVQHHQQQVGQEQDITKNNQIILSSSGSLMSSLSNVRNCTAGTLGQSITTTTTSSNGTATYMSLDPLVAGHSNQDHHQGVIKCLVEESSGGLRLPKFEEIHNNNSTNSNSSSNHILGKDDCDIKKLGNGSSGCGYDDVDVDDVEDAGDLGEYFNIHELTSSYSHHNSNSHDDDFGGDFGKIDDLEDSRTTTTMESPMEGRTLRLSTTSEEMDDRLNSHDGGGGGGGLILDGYMEEDEDEDVLLEDETSSVPIGGVVVGEEGIILHRREDVDDDEETKDSGNSGETGSSAGGGVVGKAELKCKFCGFVCCSKSSLGIHERRHTGEKPYSCKYCGRLFNSAQCCKHHERLHTGDKPFQCKYCGKKYAVSTRLKRHERVHTREEPYKCMEDGCGKTFRWFDAFRDHRNTHTGVALYLCSVCGKSFTSYLKFYYHERGHFLKRERDRDKKLKGAAAEGGVKASSANSKEQPTTKGAKVPRKPRGKKAQKLIEEDNTTM